MRLHLAGPELWDPPSLGRSGSWVSVEALRLEKQVSRHSFGTCKLWIRSFVKCLQLFGRIHWPATGTNSKSNPTCSCTHIRTHAQSAGTAKGLRMLQSLFTVCLCLQFSPFPPMEETSEQQLLHNHRWHFTWEGTGKHPAGVRSGIHTHVCHSSSSNLKIFMECGCWWLDIPAGEIKSVLNSFASKGNKLD